MSTRIPLHVMEFAKSTNTVDLIDAFVDYYNHYKSEILKKPATYDNTVSFSEKTNKINSSIEAEIAKLAGVPGTVFSEAVYKTNPMYQWASFAVIGALVDTVLPDSVIDTFQNFADVRVGGYGDSFAFDIRPNSLFLVTKAANGKRYSFAQRQFNGQATLLPENRMITVEEDLYRVLSGKRNLAEYATKITQSLEEQLALDIYTAIDGTYSALPTQFKEAAYTQDSFITLAERIKAFNRGASVSVFGTKLALSKVVPTNDYFKMQVGGEYVKTGYIRAPFGIDMFEIPQKANWNSASYELRLDDTRLYMICTDVDKLVKVALEGQTLTYNNMIFENANLVQKQAVHKRWAVGLISNAFFGIVDLG